MVTMHPAREGELPQAEALWTAVFGDSPAAQRDFYRLSGQSGPLVLSEDDRVVAMLALPEVSLTFADGWSVKGGYVYALAADPARRGNGYASLLLNYAGEICRNHGYDCIFTVPARPSLFAFFDKNGFSPAFYHRKATAEPGPVCGERISPEEYAVLREELLTDTVHVSHPTGLLRWQEQLCPAAGSGLYRLELKGGTACAAVERWPDAPVVKELLCRRGDEEEAAAAAACLCGGRAEIRLPARGEEGVPFAAVRWLFGPPPARWRVASGGWFGLGYD